MAERASENRQQLPELETVPKPTLLVEGATLASLAVAMLSLFLFAWIAGSLSQQSTRTFDNSLREQVHQYASPRLTSSMIAISFLGGDGLVLAAFLALAAFLGFGWRRAAVWLVITIAGALVLDVTLKLAFHRARPSPFFGPLPQTYSFPSGHALFSFCFYGVLAGLLAGRTRSLLVRDRTLVACGSAGGCHRLLARLLRRTLPQRCHCRLSDCDSLGGHHDRARPLACATTK